MASLNSALGFAVVAPEHEPIVREGVADVTLPDKPEIKDERGQPPEIKKGGATEQHRPDRRTRREHVGDGLDRDRAGIDEHAFRPEENIEIEPVQVCVIDFFLLRGGKESALRRGQRGVGPELRDDENESSVTS